MTSPELWSTYGDLAKRDLLSRFLDATDEKRAPDFVKEEHEVPDRDAARVTEVLNALRCADEAQSAREVLSAHVARVEVARAIEYAYSNLVGDEQSRDDGSLSPAERATSR
jgi:hypothetical protein